MENGNRVYVNVTVSFNEDGIMKPLSIEWENGRVYPIDEILDIRQAAAKGCGGQGDRYTIRIGKKTTYLFFERAPESGGPQYGRWFVERKSSQNGNS